MPPVVKKQEVDSFLQSFKTKLRIFDILFWDDRGKNIQALVDLDITPRERIDILDSLTYINYSEGPLPDQMMQGADLWVFGVFVKGQEIYIKITLGRESSHVVCISFHPAEHPLTYLWK